MSKTASSTGEKIEETKQEQKQKQKQKKEPQEEPKIKARKGAKVEPKVESKVEIKEEPKVEPKEEPRVEAKEEPKEESKVEPKVEVREEPKKEPKVEPAKELKVQPQDKGKGDKKQEIIKAIEGMNVLELSELVKDLEDRFGVEAVAVSPVGIQAPGPGGEAAAEEEKTEFDVMLSEVGNKKIQVIKEVRKMTSLGLKEAKDLVEQAPKPVKQGVNKEEALKIKETLEAVGAKVEVK